MELLYFVSIVISAWLIIGSGLVLMLGAYLSITGKE